MKRLPLPASASVLVLSACGAGAKPAPRVTELAARPPTAERVPARAREIVVRAPKMDVRVTRADEVSRIVRRLEALPLSPPGIPLPCPPSPVARIALSVRSADGSPLAQARGAADVGDHLRSDRVSGSADVCNGRSPTGRSARASSSGCGACWACGSS